MPLITSDNWSVNIRKEILNEDMLFTKMGWVYHYNSIPPNPMNRDATYWIERTYRELYESL